MKRKLCIALGAFLLTAGGVEAATQRFLWDYTHGTVRATSFRFYRQRWCTGTASTSTVTPSQSSGSFTQSFTYTNFETNVDYCVWVTARSSSGEESTPSNSVRFQVSTLPTVPKDLRLD